MVFFIDFLNFGCVKQMIFKEIFRRSEFPVTFIYTEKEKETDWGTAEKEAEKCCDLLEWKKHGVETSGTAKNLFSHKQDPEGT